MDQYLYLTLNLGSILIPFACSFENRIKFYRKWPALFTGISGMMLLFISWDAAFTNMGVWGFNPMYLIGVDLVNLPLEEWLFFICIPYACLFTYEAMRYIIKRDILGRVAPGFSILLAVVLGTLAVTNLDQIYTALTFSLTAIFLLFWVVVLRGENMGRFLVGYVFCLIPFYLINGILTGTWIAEQVVWYNNAENFGIRIGTIPVEDSIYMMLMLGMVTVIYEKMLGRS